MYFHMCLLQHCVCKVVERKRRGEKKPNGSIFFSGERKQNLHALGHEIISEFSIPTGFQMLQVPPDSRIFIGIRISVWPMRGGGGPVQ